MTPTTQTGGSGGGKPPVLKTGFYPAEASSSNIPSWSELPLRTRIWIRLCRLAGKFKRSTQRG